ncbi:acyltransferase [Cryomorpha ignava]|uniref:Acyltransferase n=1 Tax=Cryomorpha ignava TaxID=101383 RepID=A0A7K3WQX9_9FLAO|nr:acyltransferase [Cryomorpha ignava]
MRTPSLSKRNIKLDLLRLLGVLVIMVAHADPPEWIFNLRNFGTPLLILGSALTYAFIYKSKNIEDKNYFFKKRLKRLIIPAWIFLTFFFLLFYVASQSLNKEFPFSTIGIINSYNFYAGIGFVWILKVYIILALLTPFALSISKSTAINNKRYFWLISLIYLGYELFITLFFHYIPEAFREPVSNTFLVVIPYSVLYFYGLRLHTLSDRNLIIIIFSSLVLTVSLILHKYLDAGTFVPTQVYKYPPTLYYLAYAFFCINLIYYIISRHLNVESNRANNIIIWLSSNSLWIYLWHILGYYLWLTFINDLNIKISTFNLFLIKASFLLSFGCAITHLQLYLVAILQPRTNPIFQRFLVFLN